jgi:hypothetical protein
VRLIEPEGTSSVNLCICSAPLRKDVGRVAVRLAWGFEDSSVTAEGRRLTAVGELKPMEGVGSSAMKRWLRFAMSGGQAGDRCCIMVRLSSKVRFPTSSAEWRERLTLSAVDPWEDIRD